MLADRPYMRQSTFDSPRSAAVVLVIVNVAIWLVSLFVSPLFLSRYLALTLEGLSHGYVWQLVTFQFLHGGPFHLALNCFALYIFGRAVEQALGRQSFLKLYFLAGVMGGLIQCAAMKLTPIGVSAVVGASAGVVGLGAAFATLFAEHQLGLLFLPITFRAKHLLWILPLFDGIFLLAEMTGTFSSHIAHAAHLGGFGAGYAYVRWGLQAENLLRSRRPREPRFRARELVRTRAAKDSWKASLRKETEEMPSAEFISREVDPILDKISAHGIQSLTARERQILEKARSKMERR